MSDTDPRDYRTLGDLLRDAREERKLTHDQVNEATKISPRVLQALEKDDLEAASGVVYARGFVRTLALYYDLDPEWLGAKLDQLAGETSRPVLPVEDDDGVIAGPVDDPVVDEEPADTAPKWEVESTRVRKVGSSGGSKIPKNLVFGLVAVLVVAIVLVVWLGRGGDRTDRGAQRTPASATELASNDEDPGPASPADDARSGDADTATGNDASAADGNVATDGGGDPPAEQQERASGQGARESAPDPTPVDEIPTEVVVEDLPTSPIDRGPPSEVASADPEPEPARPDATSSETTRPEVQPAEDASTQMVESREDESPREGGLPSVLRPAGPAQATKMALRVIADSPVEVTLSSDGARSEIRYLQAGQEWVMEGHDHFSLAVSDPAAISLEIDGRPRSVPSSWNGDEWILYPPRGEG